YKDGKLQGKWVAFNEDGSKQSIGEYTDGMKTGKWFFWNDASLAEVDYTKSKISDVKKWAKDGLANRN
ncbi:MAG: membrane-binding protein, partial [Flavobacterium sp.]|nr:membrane-binding protein [Flavobacterium sp.]